MSNSKADRPVRIANFSGFFGDRMSALEEMVTGGPVDVATGDYLAEVTMLVLAKSRMRRTGGGYAATFLRQFEPVAKEIQGRGIKVVVNAGGLDPAGLARATRELLAGLGVELDVAHVEGDDISGRIPLLLAQGCGLENLDTGVAFSDWGHEVLTANAYLGAFGIKTALDHGADIVVTGRVADASLTSGAAAWWWGWTPRDTDALAGAVVAGHIIECGAQATGGNFSGFLRLPPGTDLTHPGFPVAEIEHDGSSVITKHEKTGGAVTVDTITAQLLYEVAGPDYLNPDVIARLDTALVSQESRDRVRVTGVKGRPAPRSTKVAITGLGVWRNSTTVVLTGLHIDEKALLVERTLREQLERQPGIADLRFTRIGEARTDPNEQMAGSSLLQISVEGDESSCGRAFSSRVVELALASFPGIYFTDVPGEGGPFGTYWPALVPQAAVDHVVVHSDGTSLPIPPPLVSSHEAPLGQGPAEMPSDAGPFGDAQLGDAELVEAQVGHGQLVDAPLGTIAQARSGDKGGNANVGIWVADPETWRWLRETLTVSTLKELLPEVEDLQVDRYELSNLKALNFVIHGLLDGGATETRRFDKQAKALGEWLLARRMVMPENLIPAQA